MMVCGGGVMVVIQVYKERRRLVFVELDFENIVSDLIVSKCLIDKRCIGIAGV